MKNIAIFLFHRDLRLQDNTSLIQAIEDGYIILPIFIFPPEQIDSKKNKYFSNSAVQFMCESIEDLQHQLKEYKTSLHCFEGSNISILTQLYKQCPFAALYSNLDYSFYAKKRDKEINEWCISHNILFIQKEDYGLIPLYQGLVDENKPYSIFSAFYKRMLTKETIPSVHYIDFNKNNFYNLDFSLKNKVKYIHKFYDHNPYLAIKGGRKNGQFMLKHVTQLSLYEELRNYPALEYTSKASPHLKFGTVSIREMYWTILDKFGKNHGLIRELFFREFYLKIYGINPALQQGVALHDKLDKNIPWAYDKTLFSLWTEGKTGYPIVDAGMRELNITGFQHNRLRMICGSVLTKYFLIDWRWGLKYYYQHLVDADIYSNTAGWGFVSSTGPDAVPYFRAPFNPFIQSKKFDIDTEYIKKWIPELREVNPKDIHKWYDPNIREKYQHIKYPSPIMSHEMASKRALEIFKKAFN